MTCRNDGRDNVGRERGQGTGLGSTFPFTIETETLTTPLRTRRDLETAQPILNEKRALIVDDNATNRRILITYLRNWGMITRDTASPHKVLSWIQHGDPFDVAVLDMHMQEMDGVELAREIRQRESQLSVTSDQSPVSNLQSPPCLVQFHRSARRSGVV